MPYFSFFDIPEGINYQEFTYKNEQLDSIVSSLDRLGFGIQEGLHSQ
jgi:hypothetical protein